MGKKKKLPWEPEQVAGMTNEEIIVKLKKLIPSFDIDSFITRTREYLSCEDLTEAEYYPIAKYTADDEDFIWMACEELWIRLVPEKPPVELIADQVDNLIIEMIKAGQKEKWKELYRHSREVLDIILRHTIENTVSGYRLRRDFYEKLAGMTFYDFDTLVNDLLQSMIGQEEYERVIEVAGILGEGLQDDVLLDYKAEGLFGMGRREEGEKLSQEIISRNPDNPWFLLRAGGYYATYGEKDLEKAKEYYLKALAVARKHSGKPDGKDELRAVYEKLIELSYETGDHSSGKRYERLLNTLESKKVGRNAPCPCGSGKKYKQCCGRETADIPELDFDRRLMERDFRALQQAIEEKNFNSVDEVNKYIREIDQNGKLLQWAPKTPLEEAQELIYEALEEVGNKRLKLIEKALRISPDCSDAYVLLAEEKAQSPEEALKLYEAGVKAGERALGNKIFKEGAGNFWRIIETRPYMRARLGLARCLWTLGRSDEAVTHFRELLRLNPNDNQGVRYLLAAVLLEMRKIEALEELLGQYDEPTADWLFTKALAAFIRQGDSAEARKLLKKAIDHNHYVASYLLGEKDLPRELPEHVGLGDKDEAIAYAAEFGREWHQAAGAIDWLSSVAGGKQGKRQKKNTGIPEAFLEAFEPEDRGGHPRGQAG